MYTPVNPGFTFQKWGLMGSILYRHVFVMEYNQSQFSRSVSFACNNKIRRLSPVLADPNGRDRYNSSIYCVWGINASTNLLS